MDMILLLIFAVFVTIDTAQDIYLAHFNQKKWRDKYDKRTKWYYDLFPFMKRFSRNGDAVLQFNKSIISFFLLLFYLFFVFILLIKFIKL